MAHHLLSTHGLYILSGAPGAGKSTWVNSVKNLPVEAVISTDMLRERMFGVRIVWNEDAQSFKETLYHDGDKTVFNIAFNLVEQRLRQKLVTVVDATNTTEQDRESWAKIAHDCGVPVTVILFDIDEKTLIERDLKRKRMVGKNVIQHFLRKLDRTSHYPIIKVDEHDTFELLPPQLPHDRIDVIGDIHGLKDDLLIVTQHLGYSIEHGVFTHPEDRKLLFLGDWLDRGPESVECFRLIFDAVTKGGHFAVLGNHEYKILQIYRTLKNEKPYTPRSFSVAETIARLWQDVPSETLEHWMNWLHNLPPLYQYKQFLFCHAGVKSLDPFRTPCSVLFYGESNFGEVDTDSCFGKWSEMISATTGNPAPILVHGHIPPTTDNPTHSFSLERKVGFCGTMMALKLDKTIDFLRQSKTPYESVTSASISHKTKFDFVEYKQKSTLLSQHLQKLVENKQLTAIKDTHFGLTIYSIPKDSQIMDHIQLDTLENLEIDKLVSHKTNQDGLTIYKYTKRAFSKGLWDKNNLLLHARGLVLDFTGKIVQNPFVKVFNYGERGTGVNLPNDLRVEAVQKLNGFLGCITKHPFKHKDLLITTTGSFDSVYVEYIRDFVSPDVKKRLLDYLQTNNETLMFEVIHPKDPHIISYTPEQHGLYLIGAREKELNSPLKSERNLDSIAKELNFRRPRHYKTTMGSLRNRVDTIQHEGYIVRDITTGDILLKFKSGYYLTVKFLSRMGANQIKLMFDKPHIFKQKIDEEYHPLVDIVLQHTTIETFSSMKPEERVPLVRDFVRKMWNNILKETQETSTYIQKKKFSN